MPTRDRLRSNNVLSRPGQPGRRVALRGLTLSLPLLVPGLAFAAPPEDPYDPASIAPMPAPTPAPDAGGGATVSERPMDAPAPEASAPAPGTGPAPAPGADATVGTAASPDPMDPSSVAAAPGPGGASPDAPGAPAEGPDPEGKTEDGGYASAEGSGEALSGEAVDDRVESSTKVGGKDEKPTKKPKNLSHYKTVQIGGAIGVGWNMTIAGDKFCGEFTDDRTDPDGRKALCTGLRPPSADIVLGFGANDRIDITVTVKLNLMKRAYDRKGNCTGASPCAEGTGLFVDNIGIGVLPGIRIYGAEADKIVKFGGAVEFFYMFENFEGYRTRDVYERELLEGGGDGGSQTNAQMENARNEQGVGDHFIGVRGGPILQIDPHHNFGFYLYPSMIPGVRPKRDAGADAGWFEVGFDGSFGVQIRFP